MKVTVKIENAEEVERSIRELGDRGVAAAKRVLKEKTEGIAARARPLTPVDKVDGGQLRASVRATRPTMTRGGVISAGVMAGGPPLARLPEEAGKAFPGLYAIVVHEDMTLKHSDGQAKFLELPFFHEAPTVPGALMDELDQVAREVAG